MRPLFAKSEHVLNPNKFFKRIVLVFALSWLMEHLLATQQHRRLTQREMVFVDSIWSKYCSRANVYGPRNDRDCTQLRRFQEISNWNGQLIAGGPEKLTPCWIGFLHHNKVLPIGYGQLSHQWLQAVQQRFECAS